MLLAVGLLPATSAAGPPLSGAIFTTESTCSGVNLNIYADKDDVYLNGGPRRPDAAGLPPGNYYVQVTEPNGRVLGTSVDSANPRPVTVDAAGNFVGCYQLSTIVWNGLTQGYADTSNAGGVYKVWVSNEATFANNSSKTDNFKVNADDPDPATLDVIKFYDADADGERDATEALITDWEITIDGGNDFQLVRLTPAHEVLEPGDYVVTESTPIEPNWDHTTDTVVEVTLAAGDEELVEFGNVCLGAGGGHTLGFWSNKNGQAQMNDGGILGPELQLLRDLNLRNANGSPFNPETYAAFRTWLLNANSTNMAYMLSAQLAAMELNVEAGFVSGSAVIYAPGTVSANALGFASLADVLVEANVSLGIDGNTTAAGLARTLQEALKNALDNANNNLTFVQPAACPFTFGTPE
jgi:hypothetical protein